MEIIFGIIGFAIGWIGHIFYQLKKENEALKKKSGTPEKK